MRLKSLKQVRVFLSRVMNEVYQDKLPADRARVLIYAAATISSIIKDGEIENRLAALEKQFNDGEEKL